MFLIDFKQFQKLKYIYVPAKRSALGKTKCPRS